MVLSFDLRVPVLEKLPSENDQKSKDLCTKIINIIVFVIGINIREINKNGGTIRYH